MTPDPKQGEREYYARLGADGIAHSLAKPFSDDFCAQYLADMTALFSLMEPPPGRVVEFGCGTGWLSLYLAQRGYEVLGVDIAPDAIKHAREAARERGLARAEFEASDYESFAGGGRFDYAIFHDALHHAESERDALRCAYAALKPGGCCFTLEPGSGHAESESSRQAVEEFRVHEKSMPPSYIVRLARDVGFSRHLVLPHPHQVNRTVYRRAYHRAGTRREALGRWFLSALRTIRLVSRRSDPGLVLLWK